MTAYFILCSSPVSSEVLPPGPELGGDSWLASAGNFLLSSGI